MPSNNRWATYVDAPSCYQELESIPLSDRTGGSPRSSAASFHSAETTLAPSSPRPTSPFSPFSPFRSPPLSPSTTRVPSPPAVYVSHEPGDGYPKLLTRYKPLGPPPPRRRKAMRPMRPSDASDDTVVASEVGEKRRCWFEYSRRACYHIVACMLVLPVLYATVAAINADHRRTITGARIILNAFSTALSILLGMTFGLIAEKWLESAAWMKIIAAKEHEHRAPTTVRDVKKVLSGSRGVWHAITLVSPPYLRSKCWGKRKPRRPSPPLKCKMVVIVLVFLFFMLVTNSFDFAVNRCVRLATIVKHQSKNYSEVAIIGDLSQSDIDNAVAQEGAFTDYVRTWTLTSFSSQSSMPTNVSFKYEGDTVYFAEATLPQFLPRGSGLGTFDVNATIGENARVNTSASSSEWSLTLGTVLRFPRWGLRIHCEKLADPGNNTILLSPDGLTYLFLRGTQINSLYASFGLDMPASVSDTVFDLSKVMTPNDLARTDSEDNLTDILFGLGFYNAGYGHQLWSIPTDLGESGGGWTSIETVLVRLNTSYVPEGQFPLYSAESIPDINGNPTRIGYDTAVCLRRIEPYILEVYNSTMGAPTSLGIVERGNTVGVSGHFPEAAYSLNSTGKFSAYVIAHDNSVDQIIKDNGRDRFYVPSPTSVSFTSGHGPQGYTTLDPARYATARALADSTNLLPYLVGRGQLVATAYKDKEYARAELENLWYILGGVSALALLGIVAAKWVPKLPNGAPHRDFGLYSVLAGLVGGELKWDESEVKAALRKPGMGLEEFKEGVKEVPMGYAGVSQV